MTQIQDKRKADTAWKRLYNRLETEGLLLTAGEKKAKKLSQMPYVRWAAAIVVILVSAATFFFTTQPAKTNPNNLLTIANKKDAPTLVTTLEDGSIVYLIDNASLSYPLYFEKDTREVFLQGNAFFDISGNKERPFLIETKEIQIEVLGTSFYIKSDRESSFELAVQHGEVKVTCKTNNTKTVVEAGQTVRLLANKLSVVPTQNEDLFVECTKRIQFKDEPLGNILRVLNKKLNRNILQASGKLNQRLLTVTFSDNSPEKVAQLICLALDLEYSENDGRFLITDKN